jgi:hypothetical protein
MGSPIGLPLVASHNAPCYPEAVTTFDHPDPNCAELTVFVLRGLAIGSPGASTAAPSYRVKGQHPLTIRTELQI